MSLKRTDENKVVFQNDHAVVVIKNGSIEVVQAIRATTSGLDQRDIRFNNLSDLEEFGKDILEVTAAAWKELRK